MEKEEKGFELSCPVPVNDTDKIILAHGSGGLLTQKLIEEVFYSQFGNEYLEVKHDGALLQVKDQRISFTTDSFVVDPLFFPGGNIGDLAVNGTVNDLAMCGANPLFISAAFIIEEGFEIELLKTIVESMRIAADKAGVKIVTGDTKVVGKGKGDKLFINTSGIGIIPEGVMIAPSEARPGDKIILSGTIADHGISVMGARENLSFTSTIESDTAALNHVIDSVLSVTKDVHVLRDPTRGGLAGALNEIAVTAGVGIQIMEEKIRIKDEVFSACEILGFDPLYVANEGKFICILPETQSEKVLKEIRNHAIGTEAEIIGEVTEGPLTRVILKTIMGTSRALDLLSGDQLPRIC